MFPYLILKADYVLTYSISCIGVFNPPEANIRLISHPMPKVSEQTVMKVGGVVLECEGDIGREKSARARGYVGPVNWSPLTTARCSLT